MVYNYHIFLTGLPKMKAETKAQITHILHITFAYTLIAETKAQITHILHITFAYPIRSILKDSSP